MTITNAHLVFLVCAAVSFALDAFGVPTSINKVSLGFMLVVLAFIF